jgi:prepilin-type N-terminal cleavage/methylation domain-containing protein/prepilin-type processing-associated H-X9-DG protein
LHWFYLFSLIVMLNPKRRFDVGGFTLVELLVVIAIIGVLVGIALPAVQMARESARRTSCGSNLKQIALALTSYESKHKRYPAGITGPTASPRRSSTWLAQILPDVEQVNVYDQMIADYQYSVSPFSGHAGFQTPISTYQCPSDSSAGQLLWTHEGRLVTTTSYLGVNGTNFTTRDGVFYVDSKTQSRDIRDGLSNTLLIGERPPSPDFWYGWWYAGYGNGASGSPDMLLGVREINDPPGSYLESCPVGPYEFGSGRATEQCDTLHFWSPHSGGAQFALCDGSVHFYSHEANTVFPQLATIRGSEVVTLPD